MQPEASLVMIAILFSNSHEVFKPIQSDEFGENGDNPGGNKAVQIGHVKGGDKVFSIFGFESRPNKLATKVNQK